MNNKRVITAILLSVGLLLVVGCVLTGAFVWWALTTASSEPEIVDTRVLDPTFAAEAFVNTEYAGDIIVEEVSWEQGSTPSYRIGFDIIQTPQQSLYFSVLLRNVGQELLEVRQVSVDILNENGQQNDAAFRMFQDPPILMFPEESRLVKLSIPFPKDLMQPVPWTEGIVEVNLIPPRENSICRVLHWPASHVLVESSGYNENGEYILEGEIVDIHPIDDILALDPRLQISLHDEQGKLIAWKVIYIGEDTSSG